MKKNRRVITGKPSSRQLDPKTSGNCGGCGRIPPAAGQDSVNTQSCNDVLSSVVLTQLKTLGIFDFETSPMHSAAKPLNNMGGQTSIDFESLCTSASMHLKCAWGFISEFSPGATTLLDNLSSSRKA